MRSERQRNQTKQDRDREQGEVSRPIRARDSRVPGALCFPSSPSERRQKTRPHMLSADPRAQTRQWQTGSRYQGLKAKATTCPGTPGHTLNKLQPPAWPPSSYPIPMAPSHSKGKLQGGPTGQEWRYGTRRFNGTRRFSPTPLLPLSQQGRRQTSGRHMLKSAICAEAGAWAEERLHFGLAERLQAFAHRAPLPVFPPHSAGTHHLVQIHCSHSPAPTGSSRVSLLCPPHSGALGDSYQCPSALLIPCSGQGLAYGKSLINALKHHKT